MTGRRADLDSQHEWPLFIWLKVTDGSKSSHASLGKIRLYRRRQLFLHLKDPKAARSSKDDCVGGYSYSGIRAWIMSIMIQQTCKSISRRFHRSRLFVCTIILNEIRTVKPICALIQHWIRSYAIGSCENSLFNINFCLLWEAYIETRQNRHSFLLHNQVLNIISIESFLYFRILYWTSWTRKKHLLVLHWGQKILPVCKE